MSSDIIISSTQLNEALKREAGAWRQEQVAEKNATNPPFGTRPKETLTYTP